MVDIVQNGGPNCLADPPGHSLLSTYQRAKNAATLFAPLIHEDTPCLITGITNQKQQYSIQPNPAEDFFSIKGPEKPVSLKVFNIQGRLVYSASDADCKSNVFSTRFLESGYYHVLVQQPNGSLSTQKLLKISR